MSLPRRVCAPRIARWRLVMTDIARCGPRQNRRRINQRAWILAREIFKLYREAMLKDLESGSLPQSEIPRWTPETPVV